MHTPIWQWLIRCLFALTLALSGAASMAQPQPGTIELFSNHEAVSLDSRSSYWVDPTGTATLEDVTSGKAGATWQLRPPGQRERLDGKALWVRFNATVNDSRMRWFMEVELAGLDKGVLYYRDLNNQWITQEAGDSVPVPLWPLPGRFPTFELSSQPQVGVTYWLRIEHSRVSFAAPISLYNLPTITQIRERSNLLLGAYFGLALLVIVMAVFHAIGWRDRNFIAYGVYVCSLTFGQLAYLGVAGQYLWPFQLHWNQVATFVLPSLASATGLWMVRQLTQPVRFSQWTDRAVLALIALEALACAADALIPSPETLILMTATTTAVISITFVLVLYIWWRGEDPDMGLIALGLIPVALGALFPIARSLDLIPTSFITRYSLAIAAAIETPVLLYALSRRATRRHESSQRSADLRSTDALTGLANAGTFRIKLKEALQRGDGEGFGVLCVDVANHAVLMRKYGPAMGERVLVVAGVHLRALSRDVDVVARLSDTHFAMLVRGPMTEERLNLLTTGIIARGLRESRALPPGESLRFHVAATRLLHGTPETAEALIQRLEDSVADMAQESRKAIRIVPPTPALFTDAS